jgi:acyl carrier protein
MIKNGSINPNSVDSLKSWLIGWLAEEFESDRGQIESSQTFLSIGLDSVQGMSMIGDLEAQLRRRLRPTLTWDYPTIDALAEHLAHRPDVGGVAAPAASQSVATPAGSQVEIERLLASIDSIPDQEVERLLEQYLGNSS